MAKPVVIILHGIFRTSLSMTLYAFYMRRRGYKVINMTYPSLRYDLDRICDVVGKKLLASDAVRTAPRVHFITHSMGGLIARYLLHKHAMLRDKTGHVVMLVPPNRGSEVADYMVETGWLKPLYRIFFGPAGQQLTTTYAQSYPPLTCHAGIIAGTKSNNPLARLVFELGQKHDGTISHARMQCEGAEMTEVAASHTSILCSPSAIRKAAHFIEKGSFRV